MTVIWDERLITRERAADLCGTWQLAIGFPFLRCAACDGNITKLPPAGMPLSVDILISAVVRHMTMNHDYSLSGASNEGKGSDGAAADDRRRRDSTGRAGHPHR